MVLCPRSDCKITKNDAFFQIHLHDSKKNCTFAAAFRGNIVFATVAQLVEQRIRNAWVGGSSPPSGSKGDKEKDGN